MLCQVHNAEIGNNSQKVKNVLFQVIQCPILTLYNEHAPHAAEFIKAFMRSEPCL